MTDLFNSSDADFIIRSCDGKDFRVHRCILSEASPFFKDLLSLPQPACAAGDRQSSCPFVDVPESTGIVDTLLKLVYPVVSPTINSLDVLSAVLSAAVKYDMEKAIEVLRRMLVSSQYLEEAPAKVYAIACQHDLEDEARIASKFTLKVSVSSEDLKYITEFAYHRLLELHQRRSEAARELIRITEDVRCVQCNANHYGALCPPKWWYNYELRAKEELKVRPTSDVIFSMEFVAKSAQFGCQRCASSILESYGFFAGLKRRIDALPSTI